MDPETKAQRVRCPVYLWNNFLYVDIALLGVFPFLDTPTENQ